MIPDRSDNGTCERCGAPVNLQAFAPCPHGVYVCDTCDPAEVCASCLRVVELEALDEVKTYGLCTACGSVEVLLVNGPTGTRDLSYMGESPVYPIGYGCEVCA